MDIAAERASRIALISPGTGSRGTTETLSYASFAGRVNAFAAALAAAGMRPGSRVLMLAPPSPDLCAILAALHRSGLVAVFVDGSMRRWQLVKTVSRASIDAVIGARRILRWWPLIRGLHGVRRLALDGSAWGVERLYAPSGPTVRCPAIGDPATEALAVVSFTSRRPEGTWDSRGARGVERTHGVLMGQHSLLESMFPPEQGEVAMSFFPLVVMHNLACGRTSILAPPVGNLFTEQEASGVVATIRQWGVTTLCGPPRVILGLIRHLTDRDEVLPSIRRLVLGGAPVTASVARRVLAAFPLAHAQVLYGASEAEPITCAALEEVAVRGSDGFFVGGPVPGIRVRLMDEAKRSWEVEPSHGGRATHSQRVVGEVLVSGPHVSARYFRDPVANACAKLVSTDGTVWHRTGDIARLEGEAGLTLLGRTSDVVLRPEGWLHPYTLESEVREVSGVAVAAFLRHRRAPWGELAVQLEGDSLSDVISAVRTVLGGRGLDDVAVRPVPLIPTDPRHSRMVDRTELRRLLLSGRF